ncbi:NAD-binding protein [Haliangium sp.]|uniref:NAD-binding protein n=1 Tax=Haliangium sp. TaxID=2663208 RepID=UPI003D0ACB3F
MPVEISLRLAPVPRRSVLWRALLLLAVFSCGVVALLMGAGASERPGLGEAGLLTKVYYTIGLFVLGGLDLGTPTGGTGLARGLLWFTYFAAPAITTASVIEGVLRTMSPERWQLRRLRNHIIIAGAGGIGRLCLHRLRARYRDRPIVVVELHQDHPAKAAVRHAAHVLTGDIRSDSVLDALRLDHASRVFLLTGDDFANLDAATKILDRVPTLAKRMVVHVANLHFLRVLSDTRVATQCDIFNSHNIAGEHLVRTHLLSHFERTDFRDVVVLAGFGRFGQSVLDNLQSLAADKFGRVIIMDFDAAERAAVFEQQVGFRDFYSHQVISGDLRDPRTWSVVAEIREAEPVFILGCGDDGANLRTALWLRRIYPNAQVVARTFASSSFADELGREGSLQVFSVADLVAGSMPGRWFGARGSSA